MKPEVTYKQWSDKSWTARVTLPNGQIQAFSRKKLPDLEKFIEERFFPASYTITYPEVAK